MRNLIQHQFDCVVLSITSRSSISKIQPLVKEYVKAMKTVKQRNMVNREMKLAIGDELQTLFHPIVNATKQAAEESGKELDHHRVKVLILLLVSTRKMGN